MVLLANRQVQREWMVGSEMFFNGWQGVVRVLILAAAGYVALLVMLRASRKRSLAKMNVFDFVYVVVIGELLAIAIMDDRVSLAQGLVGIGVLIGLQVLISWLTTRSKRIEKLINGEPSLVLRRGEFLHDAMRAERLTENEIISAIRDKGLADIEEVEAVVLETNGALSVIHVGEPRSRSALRDVPRMTGVAGVSDVGWDPERPERRQGRRDRRRVSVG